MTAKVENHKITPLVTDKVENKASHAFAYASYISLGAFSCPHTIIKCN